MACTETELIRVYFPGVTSATTINSLGLATYPSNVIVQDIVDEGGPLYIETDYQGNEVVCMLTIFGSTKLSGSFNSTSITPIPFEPSYFVGGRPEVIRRPK